MSGRCERPSPSFTEASGTEHAFASAIRCGKGLALTGWDVIADEDAMTGDRRDFDEDCMVR